MLRAWACNAGQGYHYGKAVPAAEFLDIYGTAFAHRRARYRSPISAEAVRPGLQRPGPTRERADQATRNDS